MNVRLTPELAQFVKDQVARGTFTSASEVVRAGLRLLQERDAEHQARLEALRTAVGQGLEQARRGQTTDGPAVFAGRWSPRRLSVVKARNLSLGQAVAARLRADPSQLPRILTALEAQLAADYVPSSDMLEQWRVLLVRAIAGDPAPLYEALEGQNDAAARLRQAFPFSGVLSRAERDVLLADADARARLDEQFTALRRHLAASVTLPLDIAQRLGPDASDDAFLNAAVELVARDNIDHEGDGPAPDREG